MNPIGYPKLHPVGSDPALYERRSDRSGSQQEPTCNRSDRSECFVGPTLSWSTRSRGVDRARADRLHTLLGTHRMKRAMVRVRNTMKLNGNSQSCPDSKMNNQSRIWFATRITLSILNVPSFPYIIVDSRLPGCYGFG